MRREPGLNDRHSGIRKIKEPDTGRETGTVRDDQPGSAEAGSKDNNTKDNTKDRNNRRSAGFRRPGSQGRLCAGIAIVLMAVSALLVFSEIWAFTTWAGLKMDEIIFHLRAPLEGTGGGMLEKYITRCLLPAVLIALCGIAMIVHTRRAPKARGVFVKRTLIGAFIALIAALAVGTVKLDLIHYISGQMQDSSFIEDHYVDPKKTSMTFPEKKRNLIYIYLESMEMTFSDPEHGGAFQQDIIPELTELAMEGDDFNGNSGLLNGGHVMPGSTYTMAGMFTQSSGLPLKVDLGEKFTDQRGSFNKMDTQDSFFSGVTTLGDILDGEGYNQAFMMGSDATFGGRRLYLTEHGDFEICDYKWAIEQGYIPKDYYVFWGYEDEKLFSYAKEKVLEMAGQEEPFNFSLLTVDTHFEDGYRCRLCRDDFEGNRDANSFACSSRQVSEFVRWIQQQDFYENTTIVLNGDHLTMDSDFCINVPVSYDRRTYTAYLNAACEPADPGRERQYTTLDNLPTTLAAMGVDIKGDRLGLGTNLYGTADTLLEEYGTEELSESLSRKSSFMRKLADIDIYDMDLLRRQGLAPNSSITINECNEQTGELSFEVKDFQNVYEKISSVEARITDNDDPEDIVTIPLKQEKKNLYTGRLTGEEGINLKSCNLKIYINGRSGRIFEAGRITGDLTLRTGDIYEYLRRLSENKQYSIFVTIRDDGTREIGSALQDLLYELGLEIDLRGHYRWSYYAVLIPGQEKIEEIGEDELSCSGSLPDGAQYSVISQGGLSGAGGGAGRYLTCSVKINEIEYAVQRIGLNFVIYDNEHSLVADSVEFNTYDGLGARRKEPSLQTAD